MAVTGTPPNSSAIIRLMSAPLAMVTTAIGAGDFVVSAQGGTDSDRYCFLPDIGMGLADVPAWNSSTAR